MIGSAQAPGLCLEPSAQSPPTVQNPASVHSDAPFGNELRSIQPGVGRILLQNPNGLGMKKISMKQNRLKSSIVKHGFGIVGLSEVGVNWNRMPQSDGWWSRSHQWFSALRSSKSYNTTDPAMGRAQAGGTITMARDRYAHCTDRLSFDPRHLGRWSSIRLQGKGDIRTRIVTVYCPCPSPIQNGNSTYNQHLRTLSQSNVHRCPRQVFWEDLITELESWQAAGEQLVVMGDWNYPISVVADKLSPLGLSDAILGLHPDTTPPATHNRGSTVIDGIFTSQSLSPTSGGFCMFNKIILSDHRALWIDIPLTALLGFEMPNIVTPSARRLKLNDPRVLKKYYDFLEAFLEAHDLYNRSAALLARTEFPLSPALADEYEDIHNLCTKGMVAAEKQCRQLYRGSHPWSITFANAQNAVVYWTLCYQKLIGTKVDTKKLSRLGSRLNITHSPELSIDDAYSEKDKAWELYKETKGNSMDLRHDFLEILAQAQADAGFASKASRLRALSLQEDQIRASRAVRAVTNKLKPGSTSRVLTKDSEGNPVEITERVPMEKVIMQEHEGKFHASEKYCPIMKGQLFQDIGPLGFGPRVNDILDGTYVPPHDTPEGTKLFLKHMARPANMHSPIPKDSLQAFRNRWKRTKERTSSAGPLHFAHYKAGSSHDLIGWLLYTLAEIPFISGYAPKAWQQGIDVVILKTANDYRIEKMRTIVLYHPEFNMNNRRLGWEAMNVAISNKQLAVEQYSRPGRSAIDHVLNRQLSFNQFVYLRQPFGVCSCDLTGCYDRVVHSAISLAMQRLGFPPGAIKSQFDNIQKLIHKVRTVYGDSALSYGGTSWKEFFIHPPQGFGQGNTFGPPGWSILSSTIFAILKDKGFGVKFCTALSKEVFELCGFAYVDDADLLQTGHSPLEVNSKLQKALSTWEGVINATGGAMAPHKSWWYSVDFVWKRGQFSLTDGGSFGDLVAHDEDGKAISLAYLMRSEATKMLGVWLAPDGNHSTQVKKMTETATKWAEYVRTGHLSPSDTWVAFSTTICKTLEYPLPALMLSEDELQTILWPILSIVLPRIGMCRTIAKALRYGPLEAGGVGVRNLYRVMGLARIQYLIEHPWKGTPTGDLITSNWESFTLEAGILGSLFDADFEHVSTWLLTPNTWVRATLQFIQEQKISFQSSLFAPLGPKRLRDQSIMVGLAKIIHSPAVLRRLNQCRIFLRVVTLSDITNAEGTELSFASFGHTRQVPYRYFRRNSFKWPTQECPPPSDWTLWRESLKSAFCAQNWFLRTRLGDWVSSEHDYFVDWDFFLQVEPLALFCFNGTEWASFPRTPVRPSSRSASFFYKAVKCDQPAFKQLRRTSVIARNDTTFSVEYFTLVEAYITPWIDTPQIPQDRVSRFLYFLRSCKEASWLATNFTMSEHIDKIFHEWTLGLLLAVSDGSFNPSVKAGSCAWTVESNDGTQFIRGGGRTAGSTSAQGAYRSELAGLLGISMVFWAISETLQEATTPELVIGCDGISALFKSITKDKERMYMRDKHFDIISAIIGFWNKMAANPFPVHVRGHQDDHIHMDSLPRLPRMNVQMDALAKDILEQSISSNNPVPAPTFSFGLPPISCNGIILDSCFSKSTLTILSTIDARTYWITKAKIAPSLAAHLDWDSFGRAFKLLPFGRQIFVRKWLSATIPLGATLQKRNYGTDNRCPRCHYYHEDPLHCLTCRHRDAIAHRKALLLTLSNTLAELDTCPALIAALDSLLPQWLLNPRTFQLSQCQIPSEASSFITHQHAFGWYNFFCGFHSQTLVEHQARYFAEKRSQRSTSLWASKLKRALWNFIHEMWAHRNMAKHSTNDMLPDAPEITSLREAALKELSQGVADLPTLYQRFFSPTPTALLTMSNVDLRNWFKSIRTFRESTNTSVIDIFSHPGPFRSWVGLGPPPQPK